MQHLRDQAMEDDRINGIGVLPVIGCPIAHSQLAEAEDAMRDHKNVHTKAANFHSVPTYVVDRDGLAERRPAHAHALVVPCHILHHAW